MKELLPFRQENHQSHDLNTGHCQNSADHLASAFFYHSVKQKTKIIFEILHLFLSQIFLKGRTS